MYPRCVHLLLLLYLAVCVSSVTYDKSSHCYRDVLVALSPDTSQDNWSQLKSGIESWMTAGSRLLHVATHGWAYICSVKVLLPVSWSKLDYTKPGLSEVHKDAEIWVEGWNSIHGSSPFTLQPGGCGEEGLYIQVSQKYLTHHTNSFSDIFGPPGQVFLHEWARLRYGVFEEYGYPGDPIYPAFYHQQIWTSDGPQVTVKPSFCTSDEVEGEQIDIRTGGDCKYDSTTGLPDRFCMFQVTGPNTLDSSVMAVPYIKGNDHFCEEGQDEKLIHHPELPNRHNAMCGGKSVFQVVKQHPDFTGYKQQELKNNTIPTFTYLQHVAQQKYVMVLDKSGSMDDNNRLDRLQKATSRFIKFDIKDGTPLGVVQFSNSAKIIYPVTPIKDSNRDDPINKINNLSAGGGTSLGYGLRKGLKALKDYDNKVGGVMIFLTDGKQNSGPNIHDVIDEIVAQNVRVVTIAFSNNADPKIETLAARTNGAAYFVPDNTGPGPINDAFSGSLVFQPEEPTTEESIVATTETFTKTDSFQRNMTVDKFSGRDVVIQMDLSNNQNTQLTISIGNSSFNNVTTINTKEEVFRQKFPSLDPGDYFINVTSSKKIDAVTLKVESKAPSKTSPLTTSCWSSLGENDLNIEEGDRLAVFARVFQGQNPVIKARVTAILDNGDSNIAPTKLSLLDNGAGPDKVAGDGIYARYFTQFTQSKNRERYTLKCEVEGTDESMTNSGNSLPSTSDNVPFQVSNGAKSPFSRTLPIRPSPENPLCCGSSAVNDDSVLEATGTFNRVKTGGLVSIPPTNNIPDNIYPPGPITDLSIGNMDFQLRHFQLSFTFPGADLDTGIVAQYTVFYSSNLTLVSADDLHNSTDVHLLVSADLACINCTLPDPKVAGERFSVTINMAGFPTDTQLYWRVRVDDDLDPKKTKWTQSNVASSLFVDKTPPTTTLLPTTTKSPRTTMSPTTTISPTTPRSQGTMTGRSSSLLCIFAAVIWFLLINIGFDMNN